PPAIRSNVSRSRSASLSSIFKRSLPLSKSACSSFIRSCNCSRKPFLLPKHYEYIDDPLAPRVRGKRLSEDGSGKLLIRRGAHRVPRPGGGRQEITTANWATFVGHLARSTADQGDGMGRPAVLGNVIAVVKRTEQHPGLAGDDPDHPLVARRARRDHSVSVLSQG